ncbi:hypothetical protein GCM10023321_32700 [Pseudonocardia eucalypti]|uniref:Mce/MlaD domain-containing protein n=1 Tax=Pseudonocardia eucalypti TaxID=648755 RepID=A0ABP9Q4H3_9PSEU|nr:phospholipid/cholesterol/gamma-HCH transport system substrate-binding protein [Pseudonocardia eucalypti]
MSSPLAVKTSLGRRLVVVLGVLVVAALVAWFAFSTFGGNKNPTLTATFTDSSPLVVGNRVQMNGAQIGTITAINLVDGKSQVTMEVERSIFPLHTDASAKIEPVSLLGERFIALNKGTPSAPVMPEPATITLEHTSAAVDLDQLLNTLDKPTSTALAAMVSTLGQGLEGNGDTTAKALRGLEPTFRSVDDISALLDKHNALLDHFIVQVQRNLDHFAPPIDPLVDSANRTLGAVAANRQALNDTLVEAPSTLSSARGTLNELSGTADHAGDVLRDIRPITDNLEDVSEELHDFSHAAEPALDAVPEVMDRLNTMLDDGRPVVDDLVEAARALAQVSDSVGTIGHQVMKHKPGEAGQLENLMTTVGNWAMATADYDGIGHHFRAILNFEPNELARIGAGGLPSTGRDAPFNPVRQDPSGTYGQKATPGLPGIPGLAPITPDTQPKSDAPPDYTPPKNKDSGGASGLTPRQEGNMFESLLGGGK